MAHEEVPARGELLLDAGEDRLLLARGDGGDGAARELPQRVAAGRGDGDAAAARREALEGRPLREARAARAEVDAPVELEAEEVERAQRVLGGVVRARLDVAAQELLAEVLQGPLVARPPRVAEEERRVRAGAVREAQAPQVVVEAVADEHVRGPDLAE